MEENSNKGGGRGGGEGMEEESRVVASHWLDPGRGTFETLSPCTIIIPISQMRKVRLSQGKGPSKVTRPVSTESGLEPLNIKPSCLCPGHPGGGGVGGREGVGREVTILLPQMSKEMLGAWSIQGTRMLLNGFLNPTWIMSRVKIGRASCRERV